MMLLSFERGSASEPKGHALAYFRNGGRPDEIYATYLIVPPIAIDLVKYMPPMFASKISLADMENMSAIPLPPIPEKVQGVEYLRRLAESRGDDVLFLGSLDVSDIPIVLAQVTDAAQEYLRAYNGFLKSHPIQAPEPMPALGASVNEVMYGLMGERDKLGELSKLVGKLRYAVDSGIGSMADEASEEMGLLAKHLAEKYRVPRVIAAAKAPGERGRKLVELHVSRCYKLCDEDYRAVEELDGQIRTLEGN